MKELNSRYLERNDEEVVSKMENIFSRNKDTILKVDCTLKLVKMRTKRNPDDSSKERGKLRRSGHL